MPSKPTSTPRAGTIPNGARGPQIEAQGPIRPHPSSTPVNMTPELAAWLDARPELAEGYSETEIELANIIADVDEVRAKFAGGLGGTVEGVMAAEDRLKVARLAAEGKRATARRGLVQTLATQAESLAEEHAAAVDTARAGIETAGVAVSDAVAKLAQAVDGYTESTTAARIALRPLVPVLPDGTEFHFSGDIRLKGVRAYNANMGHLSLDRVSGTLLPTAIRDGLAQAAEDRLKETP